uniref:Cyclin-like domain-containing protein n=1 Tax=Xenopus tropicalis TaxID=8364 RepID=A0A803JYP7_XENTR
MMEILSVGMRKRRREEEEEKEEEIISPGCSPEFKRAKPQGDLRGTSTPTAEEPVPEGEPWNTLTNLADALQTFREYGEECYLYKKGLEGGYQLENFLENQKEINPTSWNHITTLMINVHRYLRLDFQTLCLGINFLERYVSCTPTDPDTLTRAGATCLYMAYKVAELRYPLPPKLFLPLFDYRMTPAEMRHLERTILRKLLFRLGVPTIDFFLEHFSLLRLTNQEECSPAQLTRAAKALTAARGIAALCLNQHQDFYMHQPSLMALCCLNVADKLFHYNNPVKVAPTDYPEHQIEECMEKICHLVTIGHYFLHPLLPGVYPEIFPAFNPPTTRPAATPKDINSPGVRTPEQERGQHLPEGRERTPEVATTSRDTAGSQHVEMAERSSHSQDMEGAGYVLYMHPYMPTPPYWHPYMPPVPYWHPYMPPVSYWHPYMHSLPYGYPFPYW